MLDGCTLSNSLVVVVHNIPKHRLLMELELRRIPIPKKDIAPSTRRACLHLMRKASIGAHVAKYFNVQGTGNKPFLGSVSLLMTYGIVFQPIWPTRQASLKETLRNTEPAQPGINPPPTPTTLLVPPSLSTNWRRHGMKTTARLAVLAYWPALATKTPTTSRRPSRF
jgi:hypothetical protein